MSEPDSHIQDNCAFVPEMPWAYQMRSRRSAAYKQRPGKIATGRTECCYAAKRQLLQERPRRAELASRPPDGLRKKVHALQSSISMAPQRSPLPKVSSRPESRHISGLRVTSLTKARARKPLKPSSQPSARSTSLINNAGITQPVKFLDITPSDWDRILDVNLTGMLYLSQAVIPHMQKRKAGSIVCMSSVSAQRGGGIFGGPHYSAAKAGVLGLAKAMARELGPDGIRVNCVTPGLIQTDITAGKLTDEMRARSSRASRSAGSATPTDVAGICLFLASDLSAYITGAVIDVNGGMLIH